MGTTELALLGQIVLGYLLQWARGFKNVPNWLGYVIMGVTCVAVYVWITPGSLEAFKADWRAALAAVVSFILATRGGAASAKDAKVAPPTNSL